MVQRFTKAKFLIKITQQTNIMFQEIKKEIESFGFTVISHDFERPWGGFLGCS